MLAMKIFLLLIAAAVGYSLGRWGHYHLNIWLKNPSWAPHHWIFGLLLMAAVPFYPSTIKWMIFFFGLGLFISDLKDFLMMKVVGPDDEDETKKFFGID